MFTSHGLNHITLFVQDLNRSLCFYTEVLRMKVVRQGADYAYLESGNTWFCISEKRGHTNVLPSSPCIGIDHLALTVKSEDFAAAVEHLHAHQVLIVRGPILRGLGQTVNFLDPDGVQWEFHTSDLAERMSVIEEMEVSP